jgi:hypothetical protein
VAPHKATANAQPKPCLPIVRVHISMCLLDGQLCLRDRESVEVACGESNRGKAGNPGGSGFFQV